MARRDADEVARELRKIYTAPDPDAALDALAEFSASSWGRQYPQAVRVWEQAWEAFTPFLAFSPAVRKLLYTTNAIESLNYQLRKVTKARGHFPGDDAVVKLLWLAIINIEDKRARERAARRQEAASARTSPPAWSRASASPAGARPSTSSTVPTREAKITVQRNNSKKFTYLRLQAPTSSFPVTVDS